MRRLFNKLFPPESHQNGDRLRLGQGEWPALVYAIGDVHGCDAELARLETMIADDAAGTTGEKWLVMLGDYVDRGPASAKVLDRLCVPPPLGFKRICLVGNHELMMLDFLASQRADSPWLQFGGRETLQSYGIDDDRILKASPADRRSMLDERIPRSHIAFLTNLPIMLTLPGTIFVHAGIRPGIALDAQADHDLVWIREPFLGNRSASEVRVIHGHTPSDEPNLGINRIGIDTAAFATGILTAVRLDISGGFSFLNTAARPVGAT